MAAPRSNSSAHPEKPPSLPDKVTAILSALNAAGVPHAVGGALALAYYAEPRATIDVDINVFAPTARWPEVSEALAPLGVDVDVDVEDLSREGQARLWWDRNPIDLFFSYDPFHDAMRQSARKVPFNGGTIRILAPEHLAVCKAMFDRPKDWIDIEQILVATDPLDLGEVEDWLRRMAGDDNPRMQKLAEMKAGLGLA